MSQENFMSWMGKCRGCGQLKRNGVGLFCSNFSLHRGTFPRCKNVWCGECYEAHPNDPFPVQPPLEEEEGIEAEAREEVVI
jgi:hypothetical protein